MIRILNFYFPKFLEFLNTYIRKLRLYTNFAVAIRAAAITIPVRGPTIDAIGVSLSVTYTDKYYFI